MSEETKNRIRVKVFPSRPGLSYGNIIWAERDRGSAYYPTSRFAMRGGVFPRDHPAAPGANGYGGDASQGGDSPPLKAFRERGYWASCFPEGDGITWKPLKEQTDEQCIADIRECFPEWEAQWNEA